MKDWKQAFIDECKELVDLACFECKGQGTYIRYLSDIDHRWPAYPECMRCGGTGTKQGEVGKALEES